jgi:RNA polymerase sigma-70 factor (ECF subfamily)
MVSGREIDASMAVDASETAGSADWLDEAGFARLHAAIARPLWSYLYRVVGDAAQAEDLVQDTFVRLLKARIGGLGEEERRAYAFRVAGNLAMDAFRKGRRDVDGKAVIAREQPRETPSDTRDLDVARSFGQLAPRERAMLWLAYVEGSAHDEIAQSLGVRSGSMKVLLFRARRKLRELLSADGVGGGSR